MEELIPVGVSIVVCTYNGEGRLPKTMAYLAGQKGIEDLKLELIIVNNSSTDNTVVVADKIWFEHGSPFPLKILNEPRPGKGYAVEAGYDAAQYSYIVTVDDDNWLEENYLKRAFQIIHHKPDVGQAVGKGIAVFEKEQPDWFSLYASSYAVGSPLPQTGYFPKDKKLVWGAGMVFRKKIWTDLRKAGYGFFTSKGKGKAVGEDSELALVVSYLGYRHYFDDKLIFYHFMPAGRINWQNHIDMTEGFAKTSVFIRLYEYMGHRVNDNKPVSVYQFFLLLIRYTAPGLLNKRTLTYSLSPNNFMEGDKDYLDYRYFTAFWKWVYQNISNLDSVVKKLKNNYLRLQQNKVDPGNDLVL